MPRTVTPMHKVLRWTSAVVYLFILTFLLLRAVPARIIPIFPQADKVAHFLALGLLAVLFLRAMTNPRSETSSTPAWVIALLVPTAYAIAIEFAQEHVGRTFEVLDMLAGALGILALTLLWARLRKRFLLFR